MTGQGDQRGLTWGSSKLGKAFKNCPAACLPWGLQQRGGKRWLFMWRVLHQFASAFATGLRASSTIQKQTNKQTEDTCLRERNAPPRKGMPQPAPRAPGSACSTTRGWRSPWGAGSHHESQKWTNESRLTQHTCDPRGRICWL